MTRFSEEAWQRTAVLRASIHNLPFNTELAAGTLAAERFRFYIMQDALYLAQYSRVLSLAAAKAPDTATSQIFGHSALGAIAVEAAAARALPARVRGRARGGRCRRAGARLPRLYQLSHRDGPSAALGGAGRGVVAVLLDLLGRRLGDRPRRGARTIAIRRGSTPMPTRHSAKLCTASSTIADEAAAAATPAGRASMLAAFAPLGPV